MLLRWWWRKDEVGKSEQNLFGAACGKGTCHIRETAFRTFRRSFSFLSSLDIALL